MAVPQTDTWLKRKALLGSVAQCMIGVESSTLTRFDTASGKEMQKMVQEEMQASVEEEQASRMVAMRLEYLMERNVTW